MVIAGRKIHTFLYIFPFSPVLWFNWPGVEQVLNMTKIRGENMRFEYFVLGAVALIVVVAGISALPDFVRYMKIRSM